jgi:RNA polymerase sigma-70 factor (ECF subfamily)
MSYEELSAALELDLGTVKSRLSRARKRLCAFLAKDGNLSDALPSKKGKGGVKRG